VAHLATLDPLAREQHLDFIRLRRFRQSLLVRAEAPSDTRTHAERLQAMHVSATWELANAAAHGGVHKAARSLDPAAGGGGPVRKLLDELVAAQPAALAIASLERRFDLRSSLRPLETILVQACAAGLVELDVQPPALTAAVPERPVASPLARLQARSRDQVSTLLHTTVGIADANALKLLPLVDGTRDRAALAAALRPAGIPIEPSRAADFVDYALQKFARLGLLMAETPAA